MSKYNILCCIGIYPHLNFSILKASLIFHSIFLNWNFQFNFYLIIAKMFVFNETSKIPFLLINERVMWSLLFVSFYRSPYASLPDCCECSKKVIFWNLFWHQSWSVFRGILHEYLRFLADQSKFLNNF